MTNSERKQLAKKLAKMSQIEREEFYNNNYDKVTRMVDRFGGIYKTPESWYDNETNKLICTVPY